MSLILQIPQAAAFADYQPGEGGDAAPASSDSGGSEKKAAEPSGGGEEQPEPEPASGGGGGGSGGNFPPHIMLNMPALSPTMESGQQALALGLRLYTHKTLYPRVWASLLCTDVIEAPAVPIRAWDRGVTAGCIVRRQHRVVEGQGRRRGGGWRLARRGGDGQGHHGLGVAGAEATARWTTLHGAPAWPLGLPRGGSLAMLMLQCSVMQCSRM